MNNKTTLARDDERAEMPSDTHINGEQLRLIFEFAPIGIGATTLDGQFLRINRAFCSMLGYTVEELLQCKITDITHPDDLSHHLELFKQLLEGKAPRLQPEMRYIRKNGQLAHVMLHVGLIHDIEARPQHVIAQVVDITESKRAEAALRRRSQQLEILSQANHQINTVLDASTIVQSLVALAMKLVDATAGMAGLLIEGQLVFREYHERGVIRPIDYRFEPGYGVPGWVLQHKKPYVCNDATADLHVIPEVRQTLGFYNFIDVPIVSRTGELLGCFEILDKVERHSFDETDVFILQGLAAGAAVALQNAQILGEQRKTEQALRESEARYRAVVEDQTELICRALPDGRLTFVNDAACRYFGKTREELLGTNFILLIPEADQSPVQERLSALNYKNPVVTYEHRVITYESEVRWQQWSDRALFDSRGNLVEIQSVGRDITELKLAEQAVFQAEKMKSLGVLAGGVAHDFNNLLVSILGQISLVQAKLAVGNALHTHLTKAVRAAERAADLARQMLAYSGRGHFEVQALDFNRLIQDYLPLFEASIPKNVQLRHALVGPLPLIEADPGQIQQIIMNLLLNAAEAIGEQTGSVVISTGVRAVDVYDRHIRLYTGEELAPGKYVTLRVQDDGSGMGMETLAKIFDPFFTTKFTGRGLGLAAVLGIVRGHRGGLQVHSRKGGGTVFTLFFPTSLTQLELPATMTLSSAGPNSRDDSVCILVIDDEEPVRDAVIDILESVGMRVLAAVDGVIGVVMYQKYQADIHLVLLDMSMHGLNGEQTLHALRKINPDVRVLLSSGYSEKEVMGRFTEVSVTGFLQKPYKAETLLDNIRQCLM